MSAINNCVLLVVQIWELITIVTLDMSGTWLFRLGGFGVRHITPRTLHVWLVPWVAVGPGSSVISYGKASDGWSEVDVDAYPLCGVTGGVQLDCLGFQPGCVPFFTCAGSLVIGMWWLGR